MIISDLDKKIIRELQDDLPLSPHPFKDLAKKLNVPESFLLDKIQKYKKEGFIRRVGAAVKHRNIGYKANAMVVWKVESHLTEKVGAKIAKFSQVSHCYERPTLPQWHYNIFSMIHAKNKQECFAIAEKISKFVEVDKYQLLFSTKEFKKTSMKYFS
ncbi:Lrp/AsnC family transcriptional regulator [Proteinivorax tanatarense]|uniref:siroheme decarboxylase n=1 Tax=Proteinivorax tanatarense TaxID=1260629 RepID=A0AAU7VJL8_9FIRM